MYAKKCNCVGGLEGSSLLPIVAKAAAAYFTGGASSLIGSGGGGGDSGAMPNITVSPNINTQVSPQISPVFQQQFQPNNSAATAGTSQTLPSFPGNDGGSPLSTAPGYSYPPSPNISVPAIPTDYTKYLPYALAGIGLIVLVKISKTRKNA